MIILRLFPVILSTILFAAHVLRFNGLFWAIAVLLLLLTLLFRKPWIIRFWQILLSFAALKWVIITIELIQMRIAFDMPYLRLVVILFTVIIFNVFTIAWLESGKIKAHYQGEGEEV